MAWRVLAVQAVGGLSRSSAYAPELPSRWTGSDLAKEQPFDPADHFVKFMQWFAIRPKIARSKRFAFSGSLPA